MADLFGGFVAPKLEAPETPRNSDPPRSSQHSGMILQSVVMERADIPYSRRVDSTYENFIADCPKCGARNTFNRASDLRTFRPIAFRTVTCQTCRGPFNINRDAINPAHEMLLLGCFASVERKEYMQCVLSVAQAYEVFFSHFMHVQLIYRAYAHEGSDDLERLNRLGRACTNACTGSRSHPCEGSFCGSSLMKRLRKRLPPPKP